MDLQKKADLLADLVMEYGDDEAWAEFFHRNDMAPFLSICLVSGVIEKLTPKGEALLQETYEDLLREADRDVDDTEYFDLDHLLGIDRAGVEFDDLKWEEP